MKSKRFVVGGLVVVALGVVLLGATTAMSDPTGGLAQRWAQRPIGRLIQANIGRMMTLRAELNLSEEQSAQMKAIADKHRPEFQPVLKQLAAEKRALREAVLAKQVDEEAIRSAAESLGKSIGDAAVLGTKAIAEGREVLTEDQIALLKQSAQQREASVDKWLEELGN